jgi:hypothetical protein
MNDATPNPTATKSKRIRQVAFTSDKRNSPIAYYLSKQCLGSWRWIRMALDVAKVEVATGEAVEIHYVANPKRNW